MEKQGSNDPVQRIESRLAAAVSAKLGAAIKFDHWIPGATGDVPVFKIPAELREQAAQLGLVAA